jgi:hypothetical protein
MNEIAITGGVVFIVVVYALIYVFVKIKEFEDHIREAENRWQKDDRGRNG